MIKLAALSADIRAMSVVGWLSYATDRLVGRLSAGQVRLWAFRFYAQPVPDQPILAQPRNRSLDVRQVAAGEIAPSDFGRPAGAVEQRFSNGSACIAALDGDELAGFMWLHFGRLEERLVACDFQALPEGEACWDYDFEIMPRYRLGRTFARLWDEAYRLLRRRGIQASVCWIALSNRSSQRAQERMGALRVGWLIVLDAWDYKLAVQPAWPFVRFATRNRRLNIRVCAAKALPSRH